jgi:hypothetical protein
MVLTNTGSDGHDDLTTRRLLRTGIAVPFASSCVRVVRVGLPSL